MALRARTRKPFLKGLIPNFRIGLRPSAFGAARKYPEPEGIGARHRKGTALHMLVALPPSLIRGIVNAVNERSNSPYVVSGTATFGLCALRARALKPFRKGLDPKLSHRPSAFGAARNSPEPEGGLTVVCPSFAINCYLITHHTIDEFIVSNNLSKQWEYFLNSVLLLFFAGRCCAI